MNKSWKTTLAGIITLIITLANAAKQWLDTGSCDLAPIALGLSTGIGLIKAKDATVTGLPILLLACCLMLPSCATTTTTTTYPDGRVVVIKSNSPDTGTIVATTSLAGTILPYVVDRRSGK